MMSPAQTVVVALLFPLIAGSSENILDRLRDSLIHKRYLKDGFLEYDFPDLLYKEKRDSTDKTKLTRDLLKKLKQERSNEPVHVEVKFKDDPLKLELRHTTSVLHPVLRVENHKDGKHTNYEGDKPNCFLEGNVDGSEGKSVLSYCKHVRGHIVTKRYAYVLEPLAELTHDPELDGKLVVYRRKREDIEFHDDAIATENTEHHSKIKREAIKRPSAFSIEIGTVIDSYMALLLKEDRGMSTQEIVEFVVTTWAGVQHFWGHDLDYNVTMQLKWVKIYETDPPEYHPGNNIGTMLSLYCKHLKDLELKLDHIHIFTGAPSIDNALGRCYMNGVCTSTQRCGISYVWSAVQFWRPSHELGHNLGLSHPPNVECNHDEDYGIRYYCGRKMLNNFVATSRADCLFEENVPMSQVADNLKNLPPFSSSPPGDTPENFCIRSFGAGYYYRPWQSDDSPGDICGKHTCVDLNPGPKFGRMERAGYDQRGVYCDTGKICNGDYECVDAATIFHDKPIQIRAGGWSSWTSFSDCSRSCGTGVKVSERFCNNPEPINSPQCSGQNFQAKLCNTKPCREESTTREKLINQRANEACDKLVKSNVLVPWFFLPTGKVYGTGVMNSCEVKCATREGKSIGYPKRHGLMPNGSPCESTGHCVNGYCMNFGCSGSTDDISQDSCITLVKPVNKITGTVPASSTKKGERKTIVIIPAGSTDIEFRADYSAMKDVYVELWTKDDAPVIVPRTSWIWNTNQHPKYFASTYWHFHWHIQYLTSSGPTDQPAKITVYQYGDNTNAAITYKYTVHAQVGTCTGSCLNGGTWDNTVCGCTCPTGSSGIRCEIPCSPVHCYNGGTMDPKTCVCSCPENVRTHKNCRYCKPGFEGKSCNDCSVTTCQNGGVFDNKNCRCNCPDGFGGLDCAANCENAATGGCDRRLMLGECDTKPSDMETECPFSCGLCRNKAGVRKAGQVHWQIDFHTGDVYGAGQNADVLVTLTSTSGEKSAKVALDDSKNNFERNMWDSFPIVTTFTSIQSVSIFYPSTDKWFLDKVILRNKDSDDMYTFPYSKWIESAGETPVVLSVSTETPPISEYTIIQAEIHLCQDRFHHCGWYFANDQCKTFEDVRRNCAVECGICAKDGTGEILKTVRWRILIYTSDLEYAGTNDDVIGTMYGWSSTAGVGDVLVAGPITFDDDKNNFERGMIDNFPFLSHFEIPEKIVIEYGGTNWWHLDKIQLNNTATGTLYTFTHNDWFKVPSNVTLFPDQA